MRRDLSVAEALAAVLAEIPAPAAETLAAADALGRILAEPVRSERVIPPADNSAMDGWALRAADAAGAGAQSPVALPIAFEVPAGAAAPRPLQPGEAARIFTGAPLPPGADSVVRQEDAEAAGDAVRIRVAPALADHVRRAGEDVQAGETVLLPGERLGPAQLGMLAALGRTVVSVAARPRVAILSGGDELVEPDGDVSGGRIVASNSWTLSAQCREAGAEPHYLGIARDEPADIERRLRAGLRADVLLSSAGVSVGDRDHVRDVLAKLGCRIEFWGVRMKPGYPLVFGRFEGGPLVFGLPGNPVSAMVTFEQFVRPALLRMLGLSALFRPRLRARAAHALRKPPGRLHFVRVTLERRDGALWARETGTQSSGVLRSMALAHGLLVFPAESTAIAAGAEVDVQLLDERFLHEADAGLWSGRLAEVAGAVLLGGASSRMGRDKAHLEFDGVAFATRAARLLAGICEDVLLVGGDPPPDAPGRGVPDPDGPGCALRGLVGALAAARAERVLVVATDLPLLSADLLLALVAFPPADVVLPRSAAGAEPLCALWRREPALAAARARLASGELALHGLVGALAASGWLEGTSLARVDPDGSALLNVNERHISSA